MKNLALLLNLCIDGIGDAFHPPLPSRPSSPNQHLLKIQAPSAIVFQINGLTTFGGRLPTRLSTTIKDNWP